MSNTRLETSLQETAYQQPDAVLHAPEATEDLNARFGITDDEKFHFRGVEMALPIGFVAVSTEGKVVLDHYTDAPEAVVLVFPRENEGIRHTGNQPGAHEWLFDTGAVKGEKNYFAGAVVHSKARKPDLVDDGSSEQSPGPKPQWRKPPRTAEDVAGDHRYNQVTGEMLGWEWLHQKSKSDAPNTPVEQLSRGTVVREKAADDSLSHIHLIGEHTLATLRRAHKMILRK